MKYLFILAIALSNIAYSQDNDSIVILKHASLEGGVQLKWLPSTPGLFIEGLTRGYNIARAEVVAGPDGKEKLGDFVQLNERPILPWTRQELEAALALDTSLGRLRFFITMIESNTSRPPAASVNEGMKQADNQRLLAFLASFAAISSNKEAQALGVYFADKSTLPQKKYMYRVQMLGNSPRLFHTIVYPPPQGNLSKVVGLSHKLQKGNIQLSWFNDGNAFAYFNIYRSTSKDKGYTKLNKLPYVGELSAASQSDNRTTYDDSIATYGKTYYYKITGVDAFENESMPTDPLLVKALYILSGGPTFVKTSCTDNKNINLSWEVSPDDVPHVTSFSVFRSSSPDVGSFVKINKNPISPKTFQFVDSKTSSSNYYLVWMYGEAGDSAASMVKSHLLVDSTPPVPPVVVFGSCDTNGIVTIRWRRSPESDLLGYRVFRTYNLFDSHVRITPMHISDTVITDTVDLKQPYNKMYYRVAALDNHANTSPPSKYFTVQLPDINPPTNGFITNYSVSERGITLWWQPSLAYDLKQMYLLRRRHGETSFVRLLTIAKDSTAPRTFTDTLTRSNICYDYALQSEDEAGLLSSVSNTFKVCQVNKDPLKPVTKVEAFASPGNGMVKIVWEYPRHADRFCIYRSRNGGPLKTFMYVEGFKREYYDTYVTPNSTYTYMVEAQLDGGFMSDAGSKVTVEY